MKILGVNKDKETFIAEIKEEELANLFGMYGRCQDREGFDKKIKTGDEIDVSSLYWDNTKLNDMKGEIKKFTKFFVKMADTMNKFQIETKPT